MRNLDPAHYVDAGIYAADVDRIFARTWQLIGPASRLAVRGDYIATEIAGQAQEGAGIAKMEAATSDQMADYWTRLFSVPMWGSLVCLVLLLLFYRDRRSESVA